MIVVRGLLVVGCCLLFVVCCLLFVAFCLFVLFVVVLFVVRCVLSCLSLFVGRVCVLFAGWWLWFGVSCVLFVVCHLLCVACVDC